MSRRLDQTKSKELLNQVQIQILPTLQITMEYIYAEMLSIKLEMECIFTI